MLAAQQQHVDHLPRGVRASVTVGQRRPQLVEAVGPRAAVAFLGQRDRVLQPAGLVVEQLEVVIELGAGPELAVQPLVAGDLTAAVVDRDLPRADPGADLQPGERDRHRVAVLADRDQRLRIHPRGGGLARVERLGRQRAQQRPLGRPRLPDRHRPPVDPPAEILLAAGEQQRVQLGEVTQLRDRHQVVAAEAADFALHATLLVRPFEARGRELRREQVVRAQRDEPVGLDPPAALQHLLHRRGQVVEPDLREHAAEPLERLHVQLQERLLGLDQRRLAERRARERRAHHEQMHLHRHAAEHDHASPQSTSASTPGAWTCGTNTSPTGHPSSRACAPAHTGAPSTSATSAPCSSTSRRQTRLAVCRCLRGASRSASSHSSITARYGPSFGAGLPTGERFAGGTGDANACFTVRR